MLLSQLQPGTAVLLATLGTCLIFLEFNRPGRILPGASGLLLVLLSAGSLLRVGVRPWAAALVLLSAAVLAGNAWRPVPISLLGLAAAGGMVGLRFLPAAAHAQDVSTTTALFCGAILGLLSTALTRVAYRARRAKALD